MKAIKNIEDARILLIDDSIIHYGRIRDCYNNYGIHFDGYEASDYAFDNDASGCLEAAQKAYDEKFGSVNWTSLDIQFDGPEKVTIDNEESEPQTAIENFLGEWAKENVNYSEGRYITYWNGSNHVSILLEYEYDGIDSNKIWEELDDDETQKYIDIYNRAEELPDVWERGYKVCKVDDYKVTFSQWEKDFQIAEIEEE